MLAISHEDAAEFTELTPHVRTHHVRWRLCHTSRLLRGALENGTPPTWHQLSKLSALGGWLRLLINYPSAAALVPLQFG